MGKVCVFCGAPVGGKGEHVLPAWLLARSKGLGKFTIEIDGNPVAKRNGQIERQDLARVLLPVCGGDSPTDCNGWLNNDFEKPAKRHLERILDGQRPVMGAEVDPVARWAVKTLLLSSHPQAWTSDRVPMGRSWDLPSNMLPTMRRTGCLPDDLSLWMAFVDPTASTTPLPSFETTMLPRTAREDGAGGTGASKLMGFGTTASNGSRLVFQLVFHPLTDIEHPLEAARLVTRLWPNPPARLDIGTFQAMDPAAEAQWGRVFAPGGFVGLPAGERWSRATMDKYSQADTGPASQ